MDSYKVVLKIIRGIFNACEFQGTEWEKGGVGVQSCMDLENGSA